MLRAYLKLTRWALSLCLWLPGGISLCSIALYGTAITAKHRVQTGAFLLAALAGCFGLRRLFALWEPTLENLSEKQARFMEDLPGRWVPWAIIASAGASLALELALIRWQGTVWEIFAFYKNFGLLSCFAGLGLGYALSARDRIPILLTIPLLALQMLTLVALRHGMARWSLGSLMSIPVLEQLNMGVPTTSALSQGLATGFFLGVVMLMTALAFIPIGQVCGRWLGRAEALKAYGWNLIGSLLGVLVLMGFGLLWTPPVIWMIPGFILLLLLQAYSAKSLVIGALSALVALAVLGWPVSFLSERIYSPYQLLERSVGDHGLTTIRASGHYFQRIHDLSPAAVAAVPAHRATRDYYELPYRIHSAARRVAVVGSGTGNDVAAAIRRGVSRIDAVEIDPAILAIGVHDHPERPYANPRVKSFVQDARIFLRETSQIYDLIVYGLLDSHTLLSHASSVRLDSFVYTMEGLREARDRLAEDGVISLSFCMIAPEIGRKIYLMMEAAFQGHPPLCIRADYDGSVVFLQSKAGRLRPDPELLAETGFREVTAVYADPELRADLPTDDWPFFYMPRRVYPVSYMGIMALMLFISILLFRSFIRERPRLSRAPFFFMGAGFMLVETKAITEFGLLFGNTWQVVGLVILAVLTMAYLANRVVLRFGFHGVAVPLLLLLLSLGVGFGASKSGLPSGWAGRWLAGAILILPIFFSGIAFSSLLANTRDAANALALNLLGALCGGLLEYHSMVFGFRFLYGIAFVLYGVALLSHRFCKVP